MAALQLEQLNNHIQQQSWHDALALYQAWLNDDAPGAVSMAPAQRQHHLRNIDELHKHVFYQSLAEQAGNNPRLRATLDRFCGIKRLAPENAHQEPSFLYMPLGKQPGWFDGSQLLIRPDLAEESLARLQALARAVPGEEEGYQRYLDHFDEVPEADEWQALRQRWSSMHLMKSGATQRHDTASQALIDALHKHFDLADCAPHAPEVFFSRLAPGGYIPPHHGLSNIKLTVHVPVVLKDETCWLRVAGEKRSWQSGQLLAFDDSFQHEASNPTQHERVVLIFDVWHPAITEAEKPFLRQLCARFQALSDQMLTAQACLGAS